jgi:hypothetical protein
LLLHGMDIILPAIKGNNSFNKWWYHIQQIKLSQRTCLII